jgi:hypothetical protein
VPPTEFGINPFNTDAPGAHRCPRGHVLGLNLLSEVTVLRADWDGSDVALTLEMVGTKRGDLRPRPLCLISPRFYQLLSRERVKGAYIEVAHLV